MPGSSHIPAQVGRYQVRSMLGQGAMGRVLLAHDPVIDRDVAIKLLRSDLDLSVEMKQALLARMRHEARAAARVCHPNIITLHDMIDDVELGVCLVFEFVRGTTLKDRIVDGPLAPLQVGRMARALGSALSMAHQAGVLHRDIKPENIMLSDLGPKITDFGIARVPDSTLTRAGGLLGTPAYSAPECISGGNFSAASDQFSLAATMYEAISGRRAFPGNDAVTVAARIGTEEPEPIAAPLGLDPRVDEVLSRAMSKDPPQRYSSCEAFGEALAAALELGTRSDVTATLVDRAEAANATPAAGNWTRVALGGVAIGALTALVGITLLRAPAPSAAELVTAREAAASASASASQPRRPPRTPRPRTARTSEAEPAVSATASASVPTASDAGIEQDAAPDAGEPLLADSPNTDAAVELVGADAQAPAPVMDAAVVTDRDR